MYLIAEGPSVLEYIFGIAQVALGLGAVIFVHELGHFLVAKACGVQCDKFFVGFDIGGYKISRKWGETEYGIGILPLGGYVKMLGQDDNPAKAAEEMHRAKVYQEQQAAGGEGAVDTPSDSATDNTEAAGEVTDGEQEQEYVFNPRSYLAKSVPQRMAIISAGVVMNIIFAFIFASIAYRIGVRYIPCVVNQTMPGSPAWTAGLRSGDEIVEIAGIEKPRFRHDLKPNVMLGDKDIGVDLKILRPGVEQPFTLTLKPEDTRGQQTIGITSASSLQLVQVLPGSPAAKAELEGGDTVIAVDGQAISTQAELTRILAANPGKSINITVMREEKESGDLATDNQPGKKVTLEVGPQRLKRMGFLMEIGKIVGVQADSAAADAGLKEGDFIASIDGDPVGDPVTLPQRLQQKAEAGETVDLEIRRDGEHEALLVTVTPRVPSTIETLTMGPMSAPALGIAYRVLTKFHSVVPGSPAEQAGIQAGELLSIRLVPDEEDQSPAAQQIREDDPFVFGEGEKEISWPYFFSVLQSRISSDIRIACTIKQGEEEKEFEILPAESEDFYVPERGFRFKALFYMRTADSFGEATALGFRDTKEAMLMVYRFLQRLLDGTVSARLLGGPVTIAKAAWFSTMEGPGNLLIFLTLLSANLAVVNFLPIPVLDGGHMVFLIYEGIFRRPASEKVVVAMQTIGFVFIISLMLFVLALDFGVISRG